MEKKKKIYQIALRTYMEVVYIVKAEDINEAQDIAFRNCKDGDFFRQGSNIGPLKRGEDLTVANIYPLTEEEADQEELDRQNGVRGIFGQWIVEEVK